MEQHMSASRLHGATVVWIATIAYVLAPTSETSEHEAATRRATSVVAATQRWLDSLDPAQRESASFPFWDPRRLDWHFVPRNREGLSFARMDDPLRKESDQFLRGLLPPALYQTVRRVIALEDVLREIEGSEVRDPLRYHFSVFGTPSTTDPYGVRFEGHHVSVNLTLVGNRAAWTPFFLGANPARRAGAEHLGIGERPLYVAMDLATSLVDALSEEQRRIASSFVARRDDVEFQPGVAIPADLSAGLLIPSVGELSEYAMAFALLVRSMDPLAFAEHDWSEIEGRLVFSGSTVIGQPLYVRLVAASWVIEYANVQNGANHVHLLIRDRFDDFGAKLLAAHVATETPSSGK